MDVLKSIVLSGSFERHVRESMLAMSLIRSISPNPPGSRQRKTTYHEPNGKRECARRIRQIEAGSLRVENGLVA